MQSKYVLSEQNSWLNYTQCDADGVMELNEFRFLLSMQMNAYVFRRVLNWMQEDNQFVGAGNDKAAPPLMGLGDSAAGR